MSVSDEAYKLLNEQVTNEMIAAHDYLAMAFSFEAMGLMKLSGRFLGQAEEERAHAMKFAKYLQDVGREITLGSIPKPKSRFSSVPEILDTALKSETDVTDQVNRIADQAARDNDHATQSFLKWFIDEQVEEVATVENMIRLVKLAGDMNLLLLEERIAAEIGNSE